MKYFFTILLVIGYCTITAQSIELSGLFTTNDNDDFKNAPGYGVGYNFKSFNNHRISIHLSHVIKNADYDKIRIDEFSMGPLYPVYYYDKIHSENQKLSFILSYGYTIFDNNKSMFLIGSNVSLNYFTFSQETFRTHYRPNPDNFINQRTFNSSFNKNNKIGLDLFYEFEIKSILIKRLNVFSRITTGIMTYGNFFQIDGGWYDPWLTKWLTLNLGLKYNFK
ncbi:MAG: hypothetical protein ACQES1_10170 [Bacteroidota bacterium]